MFDFLKNAALKRIAQSAVRHGLTALGVYLVSKGYASEADWSSVALDLSPVIVALVWSAIEKQADKRAVTVALDLPRGSDHDDLARALGDKP